MSVEKLVEKIVSEEASKEREVLLKEAREKAEQILSNADQKAGRIIEENKPVFQRRAELAHARVVHEAEFEAQMNTADEKQKVYKAFLEKVSEILQNASSRFEYREMMGGFLKEALTMIDRKAEVHVRAEDAGMVEEVLTQMGRSAMKVIPDEKGWGGLRIQSEDRAITLDNRLESRFHKALEVYKESIGKDLFA